MVNESKFIKINRQRIDVIPEEAGLYPSEDVLKWAESLRKRTERRVRVRRNDLVTGRVVVVLEGMFCARRVVFLKQLEDFKALCCGPSAINNVPFFIIDERYLLKTSTMLGLNLDLDINLKCAAVSEMGEGVLCKHEVEELGVKEIQLEADIVKEIEKYKMMKIYLSTPFELSFEGVKSLKF